MQRYSIHHLHRISIVIKAAHALLFKELLMKGKRLFIVFSVALATAMQFGMDAAAREFHEMAAAG